MALVPRIHVHVPGAFSRFWDIPIYDLPCLVERESLVSDPLTQDWVKKPTFQILDLVERDESSEFRRIQMEWSGLGSDNKSEAWRLSYPSPISFSRAFAEAVEKAAGLGLPPDSETKRALKAAQKG